MPDITVSGETAMIHDLTARVGADWSDTFTFYQADGVTSYSLTGKTLAMSVKRSAGGVTVKDMTISTASNVATVSANFDGVRQALAFYDLWEKDNTTTKWLCRASGAFLLKPSMTATP